MSRKEGNPGVGLRVVIGFAECVDLPEWGVTGMRAKADTGARSSALHVTDLEEMPGGDHVRFHVVLDRKGKKRSVAVEAPVERWARVTSSNGQTEARVVVRTLLALGPVRKEIELTLTERPGLRYRMLLGRTALAGSFLVDPAHRYTAGEPPAPARKRSTARKVAKKKTKRKAPRRSSALRASRKKKVSSP